MAGGPGFTRDLSEEEPPSDIMGERKVSIRQMAKFLMKRNPDLDIEFAVKLAATYVKESEKEGVNAEVAFAQMCLETAYFKYGNQVKQNQNNFAGLGATDDGAAGNAFPTMEIGVRAHIQHLKAYASQDALNEDLVDKRFKYVRRGSAPTIFDLAGKWASDRRYGYKIQRILRRLYQAD